MKRIEGKQSEAAKWTRRICPKIKKKLDKFNEWSAECFVLSDGNAKYSNRSSELNRSYDIEFNSKM